MIGIAPQDHTDGAEFSGVGHGNPDSIIVDGSEPSLLNTSWSTYLDGGGAHINGVYFKVFANAALVKNIVAGWGQRLHTKIAKAELLDFAAYPNYPQQGWLRNGDTLFVRLEGAADPNLTTMHVSARLHGLRITGNCWRAESLTVRFTGDKGIFLGAYNLPDSFATGAVVRNCRGYSNGQQHVYGNLRTTNVLVDSCHFEDGRIDTWGYFASKARAEENATGVTAVGRGWVVRNTTVIGTSNGIQLSGSLDSLEFGSDCDAYFNKVTNQADDAFEFDLGHGRRSRIRARLRGGP